MNARVQLFRPPWNSHPETVALEPVPNPLHPCHRVSKGFVVLVATITCCCSLSSSELQSHFYHPLLNIDTKNNIEPTIQTDMDGNVCDLSRVTCRSKTHLCGFLCFWNIPECVSILLNSNKTHLCGFMCFWNILECAPILLNRGETHLLGFDLFGYISKA